MGAGLNTSATAAITDLWLRSSPFPPAATVGWRWVSQPEVVIAPVGGGLVGCKGEMPHYGHFSVEARVLALSKSKILANPCSGKNHEERGGGAGRVLGTSLNAAPKS